MTSGTATTTTAPVAPLLLGAKAAAELCGVSPRTWWALHSAGKTPLAVHLGRRTLWRAAEIAAWIEVGCPARDRWCSVKGGMP